MVTIDDKEKYGQIIFDPDFPDMIDSKGITKDGRE
jgi:hypothetical protein